MNISYKAYELIKEDLYECRKSLVDSDLLILSRNEFHIILHTYF